MSAWPALPQIDWHQPWLAPWRTVGEPVAQAVAQGLPLHAALNLPQIAPVRFVPHSQLPPDLAYEDYIFHSKQCPVREGLHDFFNGICWMRFPQTKQKLNQLQAAEIAAQGVRAIRGPVRDALTLFDENAAILLAPPALWEALNAKDWHRLFVDLRPLWAQAQLVLFGHALLEKLVSPRKAIVAHVYLPQCAINFDISLPIDLAQMDAWLAADLDASLNANLNADLNAQVLAAKPFSPLPVLGVPGWWHGNEVPAFYSDAAVFRRPRGLGTAQE